MDPGHLPSVAVPTHMLSCIADAVVNCSNYGSRSPLSTWTETLSWTKGAHAIKTGIEFRFGGSNSWVPSGLIGAVDGGPGDVPVQGIDRVAGLLPNNITLAQNLLLSLSGSVDTVVQKFEIKEPTDTKFLNFKDTFYNDAHPNHGVGQIRNWAQNEVNFFVKDD